MLVHTAVEAALAFAATNVDDLFLLVAFFGQRHRDCGPWEIATGQALGIGLLLAVSAAAARGLSLLPDPLVGALGVVPLGLGLHGLMRGGNGDDADGLPLAAEGSRLRWRGLLTVAGVTVANGGDNMAVYVPLLARVGPLELAVYALTFAAMLLVWLFVARALAAHPALAPTLSRHGRWLVPLVLVGLGVAILAGSALPAWVIARLA